MAGLGTARRRARARAARSGVRQGRAAPTVVAATVPGSRPTPEPLALIELGAGWPAAIVVPQEEAMCNDVDGPAPSNAGLRNPEEYASDEYASPPVIPLAAEPTQRLRP